MTTQPTILIVEDEKEIRTILAQKLQKERFRTLEAGDGEEGLRVAEQHRPDLILLDLVMPNVDGMTMLRELRRTSWGATLPVIILSNLGDADRVAEAMAKHTYEFMVKTDWSLDDVVQHVRETLARAGRT